LLLDEAKAAKRRRAADAANEAAKRANAALKEEL
jgi:hypothetical protein